VTMSGALWATAEQNYPDSVRIKGSGVGIGIRYLSVQSVVKKYSAGGFL